jgi:hypothetical protein
MTAQKTRKAERNSENKSIMYARCIFTLTQRHLAPHGEETPSLHQLVIFIVRRQPEKTELVCKNDSEPCTIFSL